MQILLLNATEMPRGTKTVLYIIYIIADFVLIGGTVI